MLKTRLICRGLHPGEETAYLNFARKAWGKNSPQAIASRFNWLYKYNPHTKGTERDLLVIANDTSIIGVHHRMRIPWNIHGETVVVPSLHDLFVLESYRHGEGSQLILAALAGERHAALFGLSKSTDEIYSRMRTPAVPLIWLCRWRSVIRGGFQFLVSRICLTPGRSGVTGTMRIKEFEILHTDTPSDQMLNEALQIKPPQSVFPDWDFPSYSWRFFHKDGPFNVLLIARRANLLVGRSVVSLGVRRGIVTARVVDFLAEDESSRDVLAQAIETLLSRLKVPFSMFVTSSSQLAQCFLQHRWKLRKDAPGARWFARKRDVNPQELFVSGGTWDFGCDLSLERR